MFRIHSSKNEFTGIGGCSPCGGSRPLIGFMEAKISPKLH